MGNSYVARIWMLAIFFALVVQPGLAQTSDLGLFNRTTQWRVTESWGKETLTYTFDPKGTFESSTNNGKGLGTWTHAGKNFVMIWPHYGGVLYQGAIKGKEIRGSAYNRDGSSIGTFVFQLLETSN